MISPANASSKMSESPIFSTSFGNSRGNSMSFGNQRIGRKDGLNALSKMQITSPESQHSAEEMKLLANLDKDRNRRLGFDEEELLVSSDKNSSSPTITILGPHGAKQGNVANVLFPELTEEDEGDDQMMDTDAD